MKHQIIASLATAAVLLAAGNVNGQGMPVKPADNTGSNKQDPSNMNPTADDQKGNSSDLKIVQQIRKSVVADKSLSVDAHNMKIVSSNGRVTLNGIVASETEKRDLAQKAAQMVGAEHVVNQLKIKGQE